MAKPHERSWGEGTVKEVRPGVWRAWRARNGRSRPSQTFKGDRSAERARSWAKGDVEPTVLLLGHWLNRWLTLRLPTIRPNSRTRYRRFVVQSAAIAHLPLATLSTEQLQAHANTLLADHARATVAAWRAIISSALKSAVPAHLPANPMDGVRLPKPVEQPVKAWRPDEVSRLLTAASGRAHETWLRLSLGTGIRLGEARALLWSDVDMADKSVTVSKSLDHKTSIVGPTKSGKTRRVELPDELVPVLTAHRARQQPRERRVCTSAHNGRLPSAGAIEKWLRQVATAAGVTPHSPHSTRHTFATLSLEAPDVSLKEVSEQLGHADIAITARVYSHVLNSRRRRAAAAIGAILAPHDNPLRGLRYGSRGLEAQDAAAPDVLAGLPSEASPTGTEGDRDDDKRTSPPTERRPPRRHKLHGRDQWHSPPESESARQHRYR